eukprot:Em0011g39a
MLITLAEKLSLREALAAPPSFAINITDAEEEVKNGEQTVEQAFPVDTTNTAVLSEAKLALKASPVSDITHLVRKRKADRADDQAQPECKHIRQEHKDGDKENEEVASNGKSEESLATITEC